MPRKRKPLEWLGGTGAERWLYRGARVLAIVFPYYHGNRIDRWGWHTVPQRKHSDSTVPSLEQAQRECQEWVESHEDELGSKTPRNTKSETLTVYAVDDLSRLHIACNQAKVRGENAQLAVSMGPWGHHTRVRTKTLHRTPEAAVSAWREQLLQEADHCEKHAAELRTLAAQTPKLDCKNWR